MAYFAIFMISEVLSMLSTVQGQPSIQAFNFPTNVVVGQKASATCTAISGRPPLEFRWLKNGKEISPGGPITVRTLMDVSVLVIESVDASSSGNYTCFLSTAMGTDSYTAPLDVKEPSKWVNIIQDLDLKNGDNATVLCKAEGMPLPQVKWVKKAEIDLEATISVDNQQSSSGFSRLILLNSKPEDSGYYSCIANNDVGKPISRVIYINILAEQVIKIPPFSFPTESIIGKRVSATCTPSSGEKMHFKWLKNGKELSKSGNVDIRSYSDLSTLVIDPLAEDDSGNYTCIVNARGLTGSYTTTLEVLVPPSWNQMPKDIDALSGDPVTINCRAEGKPIPTVTWARTIGEGMDFSPINASPESISYSNGSLHLKSISKSDEGMYKCNISNGIGTPLLKTAVVRVIAEQILKIQPFFFPTESVIGKRATALCTPTSGEKMHFKWLKNGKELTKGGNVDIRSFSDLSNLVIDPLSEDDSGNYSCIASARGLTGSHTTTLEVLVPPSWNQIPKDIDALSGDPVTINCRAEGKPIPTVTWTRTMGEGMDFSPINASPESISYSNGSLHLKSISKSDEGMYKCNISNGIGTPLLKTAVVRVIGMPFIMYSYSSRTLN